VRDPVSGQTVGLIDLSSLWKTAHPRSLELVTTAARTIEQRLFEVRLDQDARLRRRYGDLMTRTTDLLVNRDGYVLAGAEPAHSKPLDIPEGGGEVALGDGSVAVAASLGQDEAYLLRQVTTHRAKSAPVEVLERTETHVRELVAEQSALRQVATLVAREPTPDQLFAAVAEQVARVFDVPHVRLVRYEPEGSVMVGGFSEVDRELFPIGSRWSLETPGVMRIVRETGRPARVDDYAQMTGEVAAAVRGAGMRSAVASPIVVGRRLWGAMVVLSPRHEPFPEDTESRLTDFTELVATAIANAESRGALARLADEQAALRHVATIAASESSPLEVFGAVTEEAARVLETEAVGMLRFEPDGTARLVAQSETPWDPPPLGTCFTLEGENLIAALHRTGEAARTDDWSSATGSVTAMAHVLGVRSAVAAPIVVEGSLWGTLIAATSQTEPLPEDTELRIGEFTELVATAIANAESREALARLAAEQAALRRVAVLVAQGVPPADLFAAVIDELESLFHLDRDGTDIAGVVRFDSGPEFVAVGVSSGMDEVAGGTRWAPKDLYATTRVFRTGRSARVDANELAEAGGPDAEFLRRKGFLLQVASPIVVEGRLWGAVNVNSREPLAAGTEDRLERFGELVATAIANVEARDALAGVVDEQAALRRVATLVAKESSLADVLAGVGEEVGNVLGEVEWALARDDGDEMASVLAASDATPSPAGTRVPIDARAPFGRAMTEGRPARIDDYFVGAGAFSRMAREHGIHAAVSCPIVVRGRTWGSMSVGWRKPEPFPPETEAILGRFGDLVATAIANSEARAEVERLAEEQAALRQVAELVASGGGPEEVFRAVAAEVSVLFGSDVSAIVRFEDDGMATVLGDLGGPHEAGNRVSLDPGYVVHVVRETSRSARFDTEEPSVLGTSSLAHSLGIRSAVASPIVVDGELWGAITAASLDEPLAAGAEQRLNDFTGLVATAIANTQAREQVTTLAREQAALRRVAELVAQEASNAHVFSAIAREIGELNGLEMVRMVRYEGNGTAVVVAGSGMAEDLFPVGSRTPPEVDSAASCVFRTGQPVRIDAHETDSDAMTQSVRSAGIRGVVATPIWVEGRLWGAMNAGTTQDEPLPPDTEVRLGQFTELMATAIANAESREARAVLADEQAALRRVATLVAQDAPPAEIFSAVSEEVEGLFDSSAAVLRFAHAPPTLVVVGISSVFGIPVGSRWEFQEGKALAEVFRTGRSARADATDVAPAARELGVVSTVATPIVVEGRLWGAVSLASMDEQLPLDAEERLVKFTELVATAIANAEGKSELAASRRRIVAASDEARRRIERDLHDGTQQRLVALGLAVRATEMNVPPERKDLREELSRVAQGLADAVEDLQEISRGIHPAILTKGGLGPALQTLAHRSPIPVDLHITTDVRLAEPIEVAAYFVASEALANAAKHSQASRIDLSLAQRDGRLLLSVRDDGVGGADRSMGSGLVGLTDRVEALGGLISVQSRQGEGTQIAVELELPQPIE
jgi:GAF domain-containing protein